MDINLTIIGQTIAMIVFVWFCMKYVWPPLVDAIEERRTTIADGIAAGEQGVRDLEEAKVQAQTFEQEARDNAVKIVHGAEQRRSEILEQAKREAQEERERQLEGARADIEQERNRARDELRSQVSAIAVASAEQILKREIDARAHQDLLDDLAAQI